MDLHINGKTHPVRDDQVAPEMPLLWALRDVLQRTGTKFGCGIGACGACTVHVDGQAVRSCVTPLSAVQGHEVRTIEGLASPAGLHALQTAWIAQQVPQCGYCQSGMLMAAADLLARHPQPSSLSDFGIVGCECAAAVHFLPSSCPIAPLWGGKSGKNWPRWGTFSLSTPKVRQAPSDAQIDEAISNLCRCGTYPRVRAAIHAAARAQGAASAPAPEPEVVR